MRKKLVVLTGAGMSAESGLSTFRDNNGLWEQYNVYDVATPEAWLKNQELVLEFYNQRRKQLKNVAPNSGHLALKELEKYFDVHIITQNIDDLHERAGSSQVLHLHGELIKARSTIDPEFLVLIDGWELKKGDLCPQGGQLRPHVVWFGESVPMIEPAEKLITSADIVLVVGTSLNVYPAAGLLYYAPKSAPIYLVDPNEVDAYVPVNHIKDTAAKGLPKLITELRNLIA